MRTLGLFIGGNAGRNVNFLLENPHPVPRYPDCQHSGNAGLDGYTRIERTHPEAQGHHGHVPGIIGVVPRGPDQSFEQ